MMHGALALARQARETNAQLIYGNTVRASLYASVAARLSRRPFIWHVRDFWLSESRPSHLWPDRLGKQLLCRAAARVIANSHATAHHLPCHDRVSVVYNGIEVEQYDPGVDSTLVREQYGIPRNVPLVGTVGRLRPWKGQDRFLRALALVHRHRPGVWGIIVGGTPFRVEDDYPARLRQLAAHLGLQERVVFTGHVEDVRPTLAAMDVFVHAGDPEPFGRVVVEAMAMARPVIAFAHGALPELVVDGESGILVTPGDVEALAQGILHVLADPIRARRLGESARARARALFSASRMTAEITRHLVDVASNAWA